MTRQRRPSSSSSSRPASETKGVMIGISYSIGLVSPCCRMDVDDPPIMPETPSPSIRDQVPTWEFEPEDSVS